jgi:hypothetical protein
MDGITPHDASNMGATAEPDGIVGSVRGPRLCKVLVAVHMLEPDGQPPAFLGTRVFLVDEAQAKACLADDMGGKAEAEKTWEGLGRQLCKVAMAAYSRWPNGRPPALLGVKERNRRVREWCLANDLKEGELPSDSTIYRFFRFHMPRDGI